MTWYDIAWYIGAFLGLYPAKVYCHRGASEGAYAIGLLSEVKNVILPYNTVVDKVPELAALTPEDIENFLCVFKDELFVLASLKLKIFEGVDPVTYQRQMRGHEPLNDDAPA